MPARSRFTKRHLPWKIIYTEEYQTWAEARVKEKYLKSNAGKIWLKKYWMRTEERRVPCLRDAVRQGFYSTANKERLSLKPHV